VDITCKGTYAYPVMFHKLANELALLRSELSKNYYTKDTETYRGDREHEISKRGILAELIARHYLDERAIKYKAAPIVWTKPVAEPDIKLSETTMDIKGMNKENVFMINYIAHNSPFKKPHWYWFVYVNQDITATHYLTKSTKVDNWQVKESTYTKVYYKDIKL
tara:strand:- start:1707 stop:2198 length:492 start_codon:yes stop_codon:yes gene_type:complete